MKSLKSAFTRKNSAADDGFSVDVGDERSDGASVKLKGCKLSEFDLGVTLGTGTFGRVRLVQYSKHQEVEGSKAFYAMKIFKKSQILALKQLAHIRNEVTLLSSLQHNFLVNMVGHFQDETKLYLVLEFVNGGELFTYLRNEGRLANDSARFYAAQIVMAFAYLHSKMIAYRDLKPENILITDKGYLKVTDFGFAKVIDGRSFTLCGTPEYLAPEIIQSKGHSIGVDWWALGILIYEMLAGYPPFFEENPFGTYQRILAGIVEYPKHLSSASVSIIKALLQADLTKRLGCLKGGARDIQKAKWFNKLNWQNLYNLKEEASYVPLVSDEGDASNFDEYPESEPGSDIGLTEHQAALFEEFDHIGKD